MEYALLKGGKPVPRAMIAMSGGVDSSVAAYLMRQAGFACVGVQMKLFENKDAGLSRESACCSLESAEDARRVAFGLDMPFYVWNFTEEFRSRVIGRFAAAYAAGRTPNPCIDCNRFLKFGALLDRARALGFDCLATGHYARIEKANGRYFLKKALDQTKDQSYVLYMLSQEQLSMLRLPLGGLQKRETRAIAARQGFENARKPDSQDLCFAPDGDFAAAAERALGEPFLPGNFLDTAGRVLGRHRGIGRYTVGQRRGLGISAEKPLYVCEICPAENAVVLGGNEMLFSRVLEADDFCWIAGTAPDAPRHVRAKIRYRQPEQPAVVTPLGPDKVRVEFAEPQRAVSRGQAVVLYDGDVVLGGGTIL